MIGVLVMVGSLETRRLPYLAGRGTRQRSDEGRGRRWLRGTRRHRGRVGGVVGERCRQLADHAGALDRQDFGDERNAELGLAARDAFRDRGPTLLRLGLAID